MRFFAWVALASLLAAPAFAQRERLTPDDYDFVYRTWPTVQKTSTGIRYLIEKPGSGPQARSGDFVSVLYTGKLLNGTQFDANLNPGHPFRFRLDRGLVIKGWDQALQLMHQGEKRLIIIPADLAYGDRGSPPKIPRDAVLVFDVQLVKVEPGP